MARVASTLYTGKPLVVTMGEPAGVGGDITLLTWAEHRAEIPPFCVIDDANRLTWLAAKLGLSVPIRVIERTEQAVGVFDDALPVLHRPLNQSVTPGTPLGANAAVVIGAIEEAVTLVSTGEAAAVITNPIAKNILNDSGFAFAGHTEFLAHLANIDTPPVMMLACKQLRVVPVTIHLSLAQAIQSLTPEIIIETAQITAQALQQRFAIAQPRLAISGLNPHAGEDGYMGREDQDIIAPAIATLRAQGIDAKGPLPADTMFHERARHGYDAAICMYHDQALIPIKTLAFDEGVNVTLGLPFVRTSPDHGTAFDIAGSGRANPTSLIRAIQMAAQMVSNP